ncbi:hypothetical protein MNBD_BACTEROID06-400 [hydrothermal vent metagenome]|uniref:Uncharacterized protein n=1 Tax=hydrothermal vent metagenome TaxID=652676 RepID=A0A3B0UA41_9ZZZZ
MFKKANVQNFTFYVSFVTNKPLLLNQLHSSIIYCLMLLTLRKVIKWSVSVEIYE